MVEGVADAPPPVGAGFSEREFYAREFRGRTLAVVVPLAAEGEGVAGVARELAAQRVRCVLLAREPERLARTLGLRAIAVDAPRFEADVWRGLVASGLAVLDAGEVEVDAARVRALTVRLGIFKLVWLDGAGGLVAARGGRRSFVDLEELTALLAPGGALVGDPREALFREVRATLEAGVHSVNVCSAEGLDAELFSYEGSGTLFTRERYVQVRALGLDDFDAAHDLVRRGVAEGFLAPRSDDEIDEILASGFGAFVEGRYLAGVGALLERYEDGVSEIASLYTLTRFLGEGVGGHLVAFAVERARVRGLTAVFACTTSPRVGAFFERLGFDEVGQDAIPDAKWSGYDPARRASVHCYRVALGAPPPGTRRRT